MKKYLTKLLSREADDGVKKPHYLRIWLFSVLITVIVSITPLIVMTVMNYNLYQKTLKEEIINPVRLMVASSKRSLEYSLEERKYALMFIAREYMVEDLQHDSVLNKVKANLEASFQHFVDLSLISREGKLISYAGPPQIKEKLVNVDYSGEAWLQEILSHSTHVSDVFTGNRGMPHFVIAIRTSSQSGEQYIIRATLGMEILTSHVPTIREDGMEGAYIVNQDGELQLPVQEKGIPFREIIGHLPDDLSNFVLSEFKTAGGKEFIISHAHISESPFTLIVARQIPGFGDGSMQVGIKMVSILFTSIAIILLLTMVIFSAFVRMIKRLSKVREEALHHIEYNAKMASIGRLAAGVAHEINNPLAIINEKAGLLQDYLNANEDFPRKAEVSKIITSIHSAVERGAKITHRLLGFARQLDVKKEPIHLPGLIQEVTGFIEKEALLNNIQINLSFPENFPPIVSDHGQLQQVFLNLFNNSIQAIKKDGHIQVSGSVPDNSHVSISLKDDGGGIEKEALTHIFEPFFTTKKDGTGLGLSITYGIIKKLKGQISVRSEPGQGTEFTILLPCDVNPELNTRETLSSSKDGKGIASSPVSTKPENK